MAIELASALGKEMEEAKALGEYEGDVLIVSHAITISIVAQAVLRAITRKAGLVEEDKANDEMNLEEEKTLSFNVDEVEGFAISSNGVVTLLQNEID